MTGSRKIEHAYEDPLDRVWSATASRIGLRVCRGSDVYASYDGRGTLTIGTRETLDPDDSLAQMLLHELCHALVQGDGALLRVDFGLDNRTARDVEREHACLVVQATLAGRHGLRSFLAPTTEYRAYWNALAADPSAGIAPTVATRAADALARAERPPFSPHLDHALRVTAAIVAAARSFTHPRDDAALGSLYDAEA